MNGALDWRMGPEDINYIHAQMVRDLHGRHTKTHNAFGKPVALIKRPSTVGRHRAEPEPEK